MNKRNSHNKKSSLNLQQDKIEEMRKSFVGGKTEFGTRGKGIPYKNTDVPFELYNDKEVMDIIIDSIKTDKKVETINFEAFKLPNNYFTILKDLSKTYKSIVFKATLSADYSKEHNLEVIKLLTENNLPTNLSINTKSKDSIDFVKDHINQINIKKLTVTESCDKLSRPKDIEINPEEDINFADFVKKYNFCEDLLFRSNMFGKKSILETRAKYFVKKTNEVFGTFSNYDLMEDEELANNSEFVKAIYDILNGRSMTYQTLSRHYEHGQCPNYETFLEVADHSSQYFEYYDNLYNDFL